jgi:hypothetical protein
MPILQRRNKLIITIVVLAALLVLIGVGVAMLLRPTKLPSHVTTPDTSKQIVPTKDTTNVTPSDAPTSSTGPVVDPQSLKSIDIPPLAVTVFYSKGTPGFEFSVLKTADKTQYVQFTSPNLIGTKCTNDQGAFASIIKNPSANETQTVNQIVKVGSDTYGLSIASAGCTGNSDLLSLYQTGFKNGFSNLKSL